MALAAVVATHGLSSSWSAISLARHPALSFLVKGERLKEVL